MKNYDWLSSAYFKEFKFPRCYNCLFHLIEANIVRKYNHFKSVALFIWHKVKANGLEFTISIKFAK